MEVKRIMKKKVLSVFATTLVRDVWVLIFKKGINALPVVDRSNKLVGIATRDDILHMLYPDYKEYLEDFLSTEQIKQPGKQFKEILSFPVKRIMKTHVLFVREDTPIMRALARMIARRVDQLPVLSEKDKLIGIISKHDVFDELYRAHRRLFTLIIHGHHKVFKCR